MNRTNNYDATLGRKSFEKVKPMLDALPAERIQRPTLDLQAAAIVALEVAEVVEAPEASISETRIPAELVEEATEIKQRMMNVLGYHLLEDAEIKKQLDAIRAGIGYLDLASDLTALANLYEEHASRLEKDAIWYRAGDLELADRTRGTSSADSERRT